MRNIRVAVSGANGQLGQEIRSLAKDRAGIDFIFLTREELPVDDEKSIDNFFQLHKPLFFINCAAYTAVDKAETDPEMAYAVNATGVQYLARATANYGCKFLHISTDYVFDGSSPVAYKEDDTTSAVNLYGASKLQGEKFCVEENPDSIIIRTAWVYSQFGNNFVKTMIRLMSSRESVNVVSDQVGAPTYAADLAEAILAIIESGKWKPGIYHYTNKGRISWYDFAVAIKTYINSSCVVNSIPTTEYPTPARRPAFSLLDTSKIQSAYQLQIPYWEHSLKVCLHKLSTTQR